MSGYAELTGTSRERRAPARQIVTEADDVADEVGAADTTETPPSRAGARRSRETTPSIPAGDDAALGLVALLREKGNLSNAEA